MNALTPALESEFDALKMQLRGYEVAREVGGNWEVVGTYRPTELGRLEAIKSANWLTWRSKQPPTPGTPRRSPQNYRVRPVVSIDVDFARRTTDLDGALVMPQDFGDIIPPDPAPEGLGVQPEEGEIERLASEQRDNAAGGYVVKNAPVIPFDYAAQANDAPLPEGF